MRQFHRARGAVELGVGLAARGLGRGGGAEACATGDRHDDVRTLGDQRVGGLLVPVEQPDRLTAFPGEARVVVIAGYGVLVDNPETSYFRLATDAPDRWSVEITGAPEATMRTRLHHARLKLRAALEILDEARAQTRIDAPLETGIMVEVPAAALTAVVPNDWRVVLRPRWVDDPGTYLSQAWSVQYEHNLSPYSYFYDHAPSRSVLMIASPQFPVRLAGNYEQFRLTIGEADPNLLTVKPSLRHKMLGDRHVPGIAQAIAQGIPLGIDATIRYGLDVPGTEPLRRSQLESDNPYNTRKFAGLTPTPIGNPGLASLQAAAHPAKVDYLYFVRKPDCKSHFFTADEQEFLNYPRGGLECG